MKQFLITFLIVGSIFSSGKVTYSRNTDDPTADLSTWIDSQFTEGMDSFNIAGAAIVLMQGDSILHINGFGLQDLESNIPVKSNSSIFGVGSISKTFVAAAIMQLTEDGMLELNRDVNNYLTSFQLEYKFNDSITVEHLLTHTAGFDDRNIGTAVLSEENLIPLAQYLEKRMPPQIRPSGKVITYSNHGYALLGLIVEEVSGLTFHEYISQSILKPLEMNYSGFKRRDELKENYVTSYLQRGGQLIAYQPDFQLYYPAGSFSSTASDMGHYISMFLNNGNFQGNQILDSTSVFNMFHRGFRHYDKSEYGWLLGFPESQWNGIRLIAHGGSIQGFESQLSLIPEKNIGVFICANSSGYPNSKSRVFIDQFINNLFARLIPESMVNKEKTKVSPEEGSVDEPLEMFTGTYRNTHYAYTTFDKVAVLIGLAPEIKIVSKDNTLEILEWNDKLIPVSDLTFHSKYDRYLAFGKNSKGEITYFFVGAFAFHKLKWYEPVKFQIFWIGSIILILFIYIITSVAGKLFARNKRSSPVKKLNFWLAFLSVLFIAVLAFALKATDPQAFFIGVPLVIKLALVLPFIIIPLEIFSIYLLTKAIRFKEMRTFDIIYQSLIVVAVMFFIPWLMYYNLIGFNY